MLEADIIFIETVKITRLLYKSDEKRTNYLEEKEMALEETTRRKNTTSRWINITRADGV